MSMVRIVKRSEDTGGPPAGTLSPQPGDFVRGVRTGNLYLRTETGFVHVTSQRGNEGRGVDLAPSLYEPVNVTIIIEGE